MNPRYSFLALNALKFFRKIIGLKDEFYNRYIIKFDLISYVVDAFIKNGLKHNMLNSAVLELFEFIKIEDIKTLIKYVCEKHIEQLLKVEACPTFKALKLKYEQQMERAAGVKGEMGGPKAFDSSGRFRRDPRDLDENEENYFNDDSDTPADINKALYNSPVVVQNKVLDTKPPPNKVINSDIVISPSSPHDKVTSSPLDKIISTPLEKVMSSSTLDKVISNSSPLDKALDKVISASSPLVDYADDSDEEDEAAQPVNKRQKVSSTVT